VKWLKRYAISCLIAMFVLAVCDGHHHPGETPRGDAIILVGIGWPIAAAIVLGSTVGEIISDVSQGKKG
jgi:hypothetical protein